VYLIFFNSSKKCDSHCDNIYVDTSDLDPLEEKYDFSKIEIFIKFKCCISDNPLPKSIFVHNTRSSKGTLGQMDSYTVVMLRMQFCIHLYLILICGKYVWLVHWECDYIVITKHFDYQNSKNLLTEFIQ